MPRTREASLPDWLFTLRPGVMHNLSVISADMDQLSAMVHSALLQPFWDAASISDAGVSFDAAPWLGQPMLFWKEALKALCHGMGVGLVKEKAVGELLTRLSRCGLAICSCCLQCST